MTTRGLLFSILTIGLLIGGLATAQATGPMPVTVHEASPSLQTPGSLLENRKKRKKKKRPAPPPRRTYTKRGNPSVTRRVASELIVKRLPELAALVDLLPIEEEEIATEEVTAVAAEPSKTDAVADLPVAGISEATIGYEDREISEDEDTDQLTAADEEAIFLADETLTIDAFYEGFTDYMKSLHGEEYITDNGIDMAVGMETLMEWLGTRYHFGGTTARGIDCSAFSRTMCRSVGIELPRTAAAQWDAGGEAVEREDLQFGDLVFFHTRKAVWVSHVGVYLGNDMFCHASSRNGVTVSSLNSNYYSTHYIGGRRFYVEVEEEGEPVVETPTETAVSTPTIDLPVVATAGTEGEE